MHLPSPDIRNAMRLKSPIWFDFALMQWARFVSNAMIENTGFDRVELFGFRNTGI